MLLRKIKGDDQTRFYVSTCKYCGSTYIKFHNATKYCSDECRHYSDLEHTESRVRRFRRKLKSQGLSVNNWLGTGLLGQHYSGDEIQELRYVRSEKRKLGLA